MAGCKNHGSLPRFTAFLIFSGLVECCICPFFTGLIFSTMISFWFSCPTFVILLYYLELQVIVKSASGVNIELKLENPYPNKRNGC